MQLGQGPVPCVWTISGQVCSGPRKGKYDGAVEKLLLFFGKKGIVYVLALGQL